MQKITVFLSFCASFSRLFYVLQFCASFLAKCKICLCHFDFIKGHGTKLMENDFLLDLPEILQEPCVWPLDKFIPWDQLCQTLPSPLTRAPKLPWLRRKNCRNWTEPRSFGFFCIRNNILKISFRSLTPEPLNFQNIR